MFYDSDSNYEPSFSSRNNRTSASCQSYHDDSNVDMELEETKQEVPTTKPRGVVSSLFHQAANFVGSRLPFEAVELWAQRIDKKMSDEVQLAVMKASFPVDKGLIRRYAYVSSKASGYDGFFDLLLQREESTQQTDRFVVKDAMQIGESLFSYMQRCSIGVS